MLTKMWRNWNSCTLFLGMQNCAATVENSMAVPQKTKHRIIIWSRNLTSECIPKITGSRDFNIYLYTNVQSSFIHKRQKVGKNQMSTDECINTMWYHPYNGILFSLKWSSDTCYNMNEPWRHAKWNKTYTKGQLLHDSTYVRYTEYSNS